MHIIYVYQSFPLKYKIIIFFYFYFILLVSCCVVCVFLCFSCWRISPLLKLTPHTIVAAHVPAAEVEELHGAEVEAAQVLEAEEYNSVIEAANTALAGRWDF